MTPMYPQRHVINEFIITDYQKLFQSSNLNKKHQNTTTFHINPPLFNLSSSIMGENDIFPKKVIIFYGTPKGMCRNFTYIDNIPENSVKMVSNDPLGAINL